MSYPNVVIRYPYILMLHYDYLHIISCIYVVRYFLTKYNKIIILYLYIMHHIAMTSYYDVYHAILSLYIVENILK